MSNFINPAGYCCRQYIERYILRRMYYLTYWNIWRVLARRMWQ